MELLIEKSLSGDENAYAELIELIKLDLYNVAKCKLCNQSDIDDVFQETILKSYQNLEKLKNKKYFKTWITKILINECNNVNRTYLKSNTLVNKIIDKKDFQTSEDTISNIDESIYLNELLDKLDNNEREIAYLYFKENFTATKIATILNSNKNTVKSKIYRIKQKLQKLALLILVLCVVSTTSVFAVKLIISYFTTSRKAINTAVENNYIQNLDMDFIYDKDIGIKINYLLIDNKNMNISYVYDCKSYNNISAINLKNYTITDENGNIIYGNDFDSMSEIFDNFGEITLNHESNFIHSTLYRTLYNFPNFNKLIFNIKEITINSNNNLQTISGNWIFEVNIEDKFINRHIETYTASYCEYIENLTTSLDKTALTIDLELNTVPNVKILSNINNIVLTNNIENYLLTSYEVFDNHIKLIFDMSQYTKNIDNLNLYVKFDENKTLDITLTK